MGVWKILPFWLAFTIRLRWLWVYVATNVWCLNCLLNSTWVVTLFDAFLWVPWKHKSQANSVCDKFCCKNELGILHFLASKQHAHQTDSEFMNSAEFCFDTHGETQKSCRVRKGAGSQSVVSVCQHTPAVSGIKAFYKVAAELCKAAKLCVFILGLQYLGLGVLRCT